MIDSAVRPAYALLRALDELDAHANDATWPGRGPARRRAWNARAHLPAGALDEAAAAAIAARWRAHFEPDLPPPEATGAPPAEIATTYWLASSDAAGVVLRVRLETLPPRRGPWSAFWPCAADDAAEQAAEDAFRHAAALLRFAPAEPRCGWHRTVAAEGPMDAFRGLVIEGRSLAAPLAIMLLSSWTGAPLDASLAVTGDVDAELRLELPRESRGSVTAKVRAIERERACVHTVFVPPGCTPLEPTRVRVVEIDHLGALADRFALPWRAAAPAPLGVQGWMHAVDEAEWLLRARAVSVATMRARLERLDDAGRAILPTGAARPRAIDATELRLLGRLAGYHAHALDAPRSHDVLARIDALVARCVEARRPLPLATLATVRNVQASVMIDAHRFDTARRYVAEAAQAARVAEDATEAARIAGTRARIEAHAREDARALALLAEALAAQDECIPWETNLCACYRVGTLARLGRIDDARAALEDARERTRTAPGMTEGWRADNLLYLDYEALKLALRERDATRALHAMRACDARLREHPRGAWPNSGILVRGVEACLLAGDERAARARYDELLALERDLRAPQLRAEVGRAAAALLAAAARAGRADDAIATTVTVWLDALPDGESSPFRAPRDACRARVGERGAALADALDALSAVDIY